MTTVFLAADGTSAPPVARVGTDMLPQTAAEAWHPFNIVPNAHPKSHAIRGVSVVPIVPRTPDTLTINLSSTKAP